MTTAPASRPRTRRLVALVVAVVAFVAAVVGTGITVAREESHAEVANARPRATLAGLVPETIGHPAAPHVRARAAVAIDLETGRVLFAKRAGQERPIASLAKIMTALLVLERSQLRDVVNVSARATRTEPINLGLQRGERISVRNLLYGLLLWSGNDVAVALAEHVSGTASAFVALMNARAAELGLARTRFASPNGLSDRGFSTAADVAELARDALQDAVFASYVSTRRHRIPGPKGQLHRLRNLNGMLFTYAGATGVKTGYTHAAGTCVVTSAVRGGHQVLAVVLGDRVGDGWRSAYRDSARVLDYGFAVERGTTMR